MGNFFFRLISEFIADFINQLVKTLVESDDVEAWIEAQEPWKRTVLGAIEDALEAAYHRGALDVAAWMKDNGMIDDEVVITQTDDTFHIQVTPKKESAE